MSDHGFSAGWLAMREPYDAAARDLGLAARLATWTGLRPPDSPPLRIGDLGAGTGSGWRWLQPKLPVDQQWTLLERDPKLISAGPREVSYRKLDLVDHLGELAEYELITASALLDLAGEAWLAELASLRRAIYATLSYDGRVVWSPFDPDDPLVASLVNRHQRRDKGLGPSMGPLAASTLARKLGPGTLTARSDWQLGPEDTEIQTALLDGYAGAASEMCSSEGPRITAWADRRLALIEEGRSSLAVGHQDLLWLPE